MATADKWRRIADKHRALPARFGLREHSIELVVTRWTGGMPGDGERRVTTTPITVHGGAAPKVRFPSQQEIAQGLLSMGDLKIGPFTPDYGTGGIDRATFDGSELSEGSGVTIRVTGPQHPKGAIYRIKNSNVDRALRITLVCSPVTMANR